ncbi:helix-turn-helix transcriptional regulator [Phenylobacterium sp.]|uniref:helix-turn-helix domain-containing protein n=1 Tax=Phenylobacterium sp. TaxID=1871053 RepID=UPI00121EB469|nr:helix-turn-helix transcriptional regulator [Phenylobacterium sp.]THD53300.1 MAG: XRE family transcriptional regulator [Phenylobacterium sp.]
MNYQTMPLAEELLRARTAKGWSQRELSAKANVPQAQISRIERGIVDLRLSTFLELARLLDLEVALVPRSAMTAVTAIIGEAEANAHLRTVRGAVTLLNQFVRVIISADQTKEPIAQRIATLALELEHLAPATPTHAWQTELAEIVASLQSEVEAGADPSRLTELTDRLAKFRNQLAHRRPDAERAAYSLDDED